MNLKLFVDKDEREVIKTTFPAGESCIRIVDNIHRIAPVNVCITLNFKSNSDLFDLALLNDAVIRHYMMYGANISLKMPYLPYARQDRVMVKGESLSVKVVADFINSLNFDHVYCEDIHSDVGVALINNLVHTKQLDCAEQLPYYLKSDTIVVSPDAGAAKKASEFARRGGHDIVFATKVRDVVTGKITKTTLLGDIPDRSNLIIVDDLCDGGRTFIELAKVIKASYNVSISLYVTHGIFSAGMEVFEGWIDKIYVHNLMNESVRNNPLFIFV